MIVRETHGDVTVLRLEHGKANALDVELLEELATRVGELEASDTRAAVLTGSGRIFSAGVDLVRAMREGTQYLRRFLPALSSSFTRFFAARLPIVAAVNGHAIAGGCILAAACDHRVMADGGGRIGVTEMLVGVPFPPAAFETLRFLLPPHRLQELVLTGRTVHAREAQEIGLVDDVVPADEVLDRALTVATQLGKIPRATFAVTKRQLRQTALDAIERSPVAGEIDAMWTSDDIQAAMRAYMESVQRRG